MLKPQISRKRPIELQDVFNGFTAAFLKPMNRYMKVHFGFTFPFTKTPNPPLFSRKIIQNEFFDLSIFL
jgi:hypothetical protein